MFVQNATTDARSDEELFAALRSGDRKALAPLWERYAYLLYGVAMKYLKNTDRAKDQVMETFADLPALAAKHEVRAFRPWIHQVVRNRCLMALRRKDPHVALHAEPEAPSDELGERALREASLQALEEAILQLSAGQADCIRLFHLHGKSYRQVAEQTGFTVERVRSHLQNGRRLLRIILEQDDIAH